MRRTAAVLLGTLAAMSALAATSSAGLLEPVTIEAAAPEKVAAGSQFKLEVAVEAEAGALAIAVGTPRVQVKLAPECGGSFAGTEGPTALEQTLPAPGSGAYKQTVSGKTSVPGPGTYAVCAFLDDGQDRQFATDTEEEVTVLSGSAAARLCTAATRQLESAKRRLKRLEHRIHKVRRQVKHAHGAHRRALVRKLHKLQKHKRKAAKRRKAAARRVAGVCT